MTDSKLISATRPTRPQQFFSAPRCARCDTECKPSFPNTVQEDGRWDSTQIENGVVFTVNGGYGMYFDFDRSYPLFAMCGECVDIMRNTPGNEWLDKLFNQISEAQY